MDNIATFKDTIRLFQEDEVLRKATIEMQQKERLYLDQYRTVVRRKKTENPNVSVVEDTSFHSAHEVLKNGAGKTAVLNFANAYNPGGGVLEGASAQEESLCRCSNLYLGLTLPYFVQNYYKWNQRNTGIKGTNHLIYSPGVTVIKDDAYHLMRKEDFFQVDVISCAAPYNDLGRKHPIMNEDLQDIFYHRWQNILEVAIGNDVDVLILGAFGCGAFNNPPLLVAEQLKKLLYEKEYDEYFQKILIAIRNDSAGKNNLQMFNEAFQSRA